MKVAVICRMNQVRSAFSEILISSQFPEVEVNSAGIGDASGKMPIQRVGEIASEWGLGNFSIVPKGINDIRKSIEASDLILLSENSFSEYFLDWQLIGKIKTFDDIVLDNSFVPLDPINLSDKEFEVELAKVSYVTIRAIESEIILPSRFPIQIIIPLNASDSELAFTYAKFESENRNSFLIDVDFRSPITREFADNIECIFFNPESLSPHLIQHFEKSTKILTPDREYRIPEKILISGDFRRNIRDFANIAPVTIISPPRCIQGMSIPDSYLAATCATSITTVGC